jgi:transposase
MPTTKPPYAPQFREQMVELVRAGRKPSELAKEFGCSEQSIANWIARAAGERRKLGRGRDVLTSAEREELSRLRRENRRLRQERDILAKATAWFAVKGDKTSNGSTNS